MWLRVCSWQFLSKGILYHYGHFVVLAFGLWHVVQYVSLLDLRIGIFYLCVSTHLRGDVSAQLGRCVDAKFFPALLRHVVFLGWYEFVLVHRVDVPPFCIFVRWHSVQAFSHDAYGGGASVQRKYPFNLLVHSQRSFYSFIDIVNGSFVA